MDLSSGVWDIFLTTTFQLVLPQTFTNTSQEVLPGIQYESVSVEEILNQLEDASATKKEEHRSNRSSTSTPEKDIYIYRTYYMYIHSVLCLSVLSRQRGQALQQLAGECLPHLGSCLHPTGTSRCSKANLFYEELCPSKQDLSQKLQSHQHISVQVHEHEHREVSWSVETAIKPSDSLCRNLEQSHRLN